MGEDSVRDLITLDVKNSRLYIDTVFDLFISNVMNKPLNPVSCIREFFTWAEIITGSEIRKKIFIKFLEDKVTTIPILSKELNYPLNMVWHEIKNLEAKGLVESIVNARYIPKIPGRQPTIYGLVRHYLPEHVAQAVEKHKLINMPNYVLVNRLSQTIIDDYLAIRSSKEITYNEILALCKGNCPGFFSPDISEQVAKVMVKNGVKVVF